MEEKSIIDKLGVRGGKRCSFQRAAEGKGEGLHHLYGCWWCLLVNNRGNVGGGKGQGLRRDWLARESPNG